MGRKKIVTELIKDEKARQLTFNKRKAGLIKKANEIAVMCDIEVALIIITPTNRLIQYSSQDVEHTLSRYANQSSSYAESRNNEDFVKMQLADEGLYEGSDEDEDDGQDALKPKKTKLKVNGLKIDTSPQISPMLQQQQNFDAMLPSSMGSPSQLFGDLVAYQPASPEEQTFVKRSHKREHSVELLVESPKEVNIRKKNPRAAI